MQWNDKPGGGFSGEGVKPWLPYGDLTKTNVARQRDEPDSHLGYTRHLIRARKDVAGLVDGGYEAIDSPAGTWVYRRGQDTIVALNFSDETVTIEGVEGLVRLTTAPGRIDEHAPGRIDLQPLQGVVIVPEVE